MKRILRSRLPERFSGRVPPVLTEVAIGVGIPAVLTLARMALIPWAGDRAPFAFVFIAAVGSTVLAGWRSGILSVVTGQLLAWFLIIDPGSYAVQKTEHINAIAVASVAQLVAVGIVWLYQREVDRAWSRREAQVDLIHEALVEIDHRTANNYQTVLALILAQARRAKDPSVKEALQQVADRIKAIALASKQLALSSDSLEEVRVTHHLGELCAQIRQGLSRPGIKVECRLDDVRLGPEQAIAMSILVNELVTNALKHAFPDDRQGEIRVLLGKSAGGLLLEIADDGVGMTRGARTRGTGLGTRLVDTFVKQLRARHEVETGDGGTRHRILCPLAA
ncbi:MAG TPA: sensor histidine kinase [Sphingomicrobium sp.]|nr:sensor histidine kinase [Sphingomicrobium sp.]